MLFSYEILILTPAIRRQTYAEIADLQSLLSMNTPGLGSGIIPLYSPPCVDALSGRFFTATSYHTPFSDFCHGRIFSFQFKCHISRTLIVFLHP